MKKIFMCCLVAISIQLHAQTILDYYKKFPEKDFISMDSSEGHMRVIVDEKNAFISVKYDDPDYGYEYNGKIEFTYFLRKDKKKIFGFTTFFDGPSSISTQTNFYTYEKGEWNDITALVLPAVTLEKFDSTSTLRDSVYSAYRIQYSLPQQGTDLTLTVQPVGENDAPFEYGKYDAFIHSLPSLTLFWNREKGIFQWNK